MQALKRMLPQSFKRTVINTKQDFLDKMDRRKFAAFLRSIKHKKKVYILDGCDHRNLGDQAILMAEIEFIKTHLQDYEIVSVGLGKFPLYANIVKECIEPHDIIALHGGGNLGNEYKVAEKTRRTIIQMFPGNKIVLFPQTMYFKNNDDGRSELRTSRSVYSRHPDLTLVARERTSYELMKQSFPNNRVLLTPDIVLSMNKFVPGTERRGALFCCRNDIEGLLSPADKDKILCWLTLHYGRVDTTDTVGGNNFESVERKLDEFRKARIVVTDRLHGMVFAAITGTPCIALSNYNYKVAGTYEWIKHLGYIKYADRMDQLPSLMEELKQLKHTSYNNQFARPYYYQIAEAMLGNAASPSSRDRAAAFE